jgi:predicted adenylyl cyclase CyaB
MAIEVEIKAYVDDRPALERLLEERCRRLREFIKEDRYFTGASGSTHNDFRLRIDEETATVTFKKKRLVGGGEANDEREFHVDNPQAFVELAQRVGCSEYLRKRKRGVAFACREADEPAVHVELTEVDSLGTFLELEVVLDNVGDGEHADAVISQWHARLRSLMVELGVDPGRIEPRTYSALLEELHKV